jgi:DNA-binding SARP family transcriptional activator
MALIRLDFLGGFQATTADGVLIPISSKKGRALLAYLASQPRPQTRERLTGLLWSDREQAQAQNSLRHELVELRRAFDGVRPSPLAFSGDMVGLVAEATSDVGEFERRVGSDTVEDLQAATKLYRGGFLEGIAIRDSVFDEWLTGERARLQELAIAAFDRLVPRLTGDAALIAAKALLALDPLREASHRALMRIHAARNEPDLALRQYQACRDLLRQELNVEPASDTEALHRQIRDGERLPPVPDAARQTFGAQPAKALLAVLPFEVSSGDPDLSDIAAGLVDEVATGMARFHLVSVASRHLVKDRAAEPRQLRNEFGAHYVLTGSLRRSGKRMRAAAQLTETETGRELWSERYDRGVDDAFAIQDELAQAVIAQIEHVLVAAEHRRAIASGVGDQKTLNQKAGWHLFRFTREDNARAIDLLRTAIAQNPDADRRYQALALALGLDLAFGWTSSPQDTIAEALGAAERSVMLRDGDAWNHATLSWSLLFARQFERSIASAKRMIELNPNSGVSYGVSSLAHAHCGDAEAALDLLETARRMAPQAPFMFNYLTGGAIALYRLGRYAEAADMAESAGLRRPNYFQPQLILAAALSKAGDAERSAAALAAARRIAPSASADWLKPLMPVREAGALADFVATLH